MSKFEDFYKVGRRLGCGSEAAVFQGIRLSDRFPLAIKMVSKNSLQEYQLECIGNELRALSELSHPRIISLFDAFEDDKGFYICMELARGGQLSIEYQRRQFIMRAKRDQLALQFLKL